MTTAPAAAPAPAALMPAVVCMNLQAAQDTIQAAGVFFSRSEDASGRGRAQVMDRNWVVVAQEPAPGTPVGEAQAVLSVVKNDEPSQC
ncbi:MULTISPECIES: calcium-binding protein [unclassified Nocardia]|uniref:calcium-binding protein n=1 Tax=unclassified Nocardia TaxID=2637762 RepID=UPI0027E22D16|nr:calcium-binding protein [Nocardia sp. MH4]